MSGSGRIAKNTFFLYARLGISSIAIFFSTKIVLNTLGTEDFGIFNLISGVILLLSFLNGAMTITTQRYLSFHLGSSDTKKRSTILITSLVLHIAIAFSIVLVLELLCYPMFQYFINIPASRTEAAFYVYQLTVLSTFFTISAVPYDSLINAYEDLGFDSILGIAESCIRLGIATLITYIPYEYDRLVCYSIFLALSVILIRIAKYLWCKFRYVEMKKLTFDIWDKNLLREMTSYASWNLFGSLCYLSSSQGIAIILNRFHGPSINAAYAIASQANSQALSFSVLISKASNPQIVKSEGKGQRGQMINIALKSSRFGTYSMLLIIVPLIVQMESVLKLWLGSPPEYTSVFCIIILINSLINQMSSGLKAIVQATGKIKKYQAVVGGTIIAILPLSYCLLKLGLPPYCTLLCMTAIELFSLHLRLKIAKEITDGELKISEFYKSNVLRVFMIFIFTGIITSQFTDLFPNNLTGFVTVSLLSVLITATTIWITGLSKTEREGVYRISRDLKTKLGFNG